MNKRVMLTLWVVLGLAFAVWAAGGLMSQEPPGTPAATTHTTAAATLVIDDSEHSTWMPINNTFVRHRDPNYDVGKDFREGLLFQPGKFKHYRANSYIDTKMSMIFSDPNGDQLTLSRKEFEEVKNNQDPNAVKWIDIVGGDSRMTKDDLVHLLPGSTRAGGACEKIDESVRKGRPSFCEASACNAGRLKQIPGHCVRNLQIHGHFMPFAAVITYWQGAQRYGVRAIADQEGRNGYEFEFNDKITVYIHRWKGGDPQKLEGVTRILMTTDGGGNHGPHYEPPW